MEKYEPSRSYPGDAFFNYYLHMGFYGSNFNFADYTAAMGKVGRDSKSNK